MTETTWTATTITLSKLKPWERNPKRISKAHAARLLDLWERLGQFQTIAIGPGGEVYDGHQRLSVLKAKHGGGYVVQVLQASRPLTEAEREELTIAAHSGTTGAWDWDALAGWDVENLTAWGLDEELLKDWNAGATALREMLAAETAATGEDPGPQVDKASELQAKWQTATGQLWLLDSGNGYEHRLICGDCTDREVVARVMGGEKLGGVVTDPPYSSGGFTRGDRQASTRDKYQFRNDEVQVQYLDFAGDNKDQRSWITWCHLWLSLFLQHARPGAVFALFIDWRQLPALTDAVQSAGWLWRGVAVWDKTEAARPLYGRFKPQCEYVVWGSAGSLPLNDGTPSYPGVCRLPVVLKDKQHLTQKPVEVGEWSLSMTKPGEIVVDPFLGSGTTLIACERLGRRARCVEIEPGYVAVALERFYQMTGVEPVLLEAA